MESVLLRLKHDHRLKYFLSYCVEVSYRGNVPKVMNNQIALCTLPGARSLYNHMGSSSVTPLTTSSFTLTLVFSMVYSSRFGPCLSVKDSLELCNGA